MSQPIRPYLTEQQQSMSQSISHQSTNHTIPDRTITVSQSVMNQPIRPCLTELQQSISHESTIQPIRPYLTEKQQSLSHESTNHTIPDRKIT